jgi:hypothetical protein
MATSHFLAGSTSLVFYYSVIPLPVLVSLWKISFLGK